MDYYSTTDTEEELYFMPYYSNRLERGLNQRMFLLEVSRIMDIPEDEVISDNFIWKFRVQGTTSTYLLNISSSNFSCSCPDFHERGRICKHMYFIIGRIGQCNNLLETLETQIENGNRGSRLTDEELSILTYALTNRLQERLGLIKEKKKETPEETKVIIDDDCTICYETLGEDAVECRDGEGNHCAYYFHRECIDSWLKTSKSCPLCRRSWNKNTGNDINDPNFDPMEYLNNKKILLQTT